MCTHRPSIAFWMIWWYQWIGWIKRQNHKWILKNVRLLATVDMQKIKRIVSVSKEIFDIWSSDASKFKRYLSNLYLKAGKLAHPNAVWNFQQIDDDRVLVLSNWIIRGQGHTKKWYLLAGWQKLHGSTGDTRRKVWTQMKIFAKRVFTIFASNASFLRVIANLQN